MTRTEANATRTADKLRARGYEPVVLPLFACRDTGTRLPEADFDGFVFTSRHAIETLNERGWRPRSANLIAYCVGEKTAEAARKLGFNNVIAGNGTAAQLAERIVEETKEKPCKILYLAGVDRAFDMAAGLANSSNQLEIAEIYSIEPIVPSQGQIQATIEAVSGGAVLGFSERTAAHMGHVLFPNGKEDRAETLHFIALSEKVAASVLQYSWRKIYVSDAPNEHSVLEKLETLPCVR